MTKERDEEIRQDWSAALASVEEGEDFSMDIGWCFTDDDIKELARLHKANQHREKPIISQHEYEIAENLARMKSEIDQMLFLNINILNNEEAFKRDILAIIGKELIGMDIKADLQDRKYINNLITSEYLGQYHYA